MSLDELSAAERAAAEQAVAALRAQNDERDALTPLHALVEAQVAHEATAGAGFGIDRAEQPEPAPPRRKRTAAEQVEERLAEQEAEGVEDFDAFWSQQSRTGKVLRNVCGLDLHLPAALPLAFELESRRLANDRSLRAVHRLFGLLYGEGTLAQLIERRLDPEQLSVLLLWGVANSGGGDLDLAGAQAQYEDMKARQAEGKPLVPSAYGGTSSGIGTSSKRTSHGNTRKKGRKKR